MTEKGTRPSLIRRIWEAEFLPDPHGLVGLGMALGVLLSYLSLPQDPMGHLWSDNPFLEGLGHAWLILGPPTSVYLGLRHACLRGDSPLPIVSIPLGIFLTVVTFLGLGVALL